MGQSEKLQSELLAEKYLPNASEAQQRAAFHHAWSEGHSEGDDGIERAYEAVAYVVNAT